MVTFQELETDSYYHNLLTPNEVQLLPYLTEAVELVDAVFKQQVNDEQLGANMYPADATKEEIEGAAQKNNAIFAPFTVVQYDKGHNLTAIPYSIYYKEQLDPIIRKLTRAEELCTDRTFRQYLRALIHGLQTDEYDDADIAWLKIRSSKICLIIGPYERYLDRLFFRKRFFQGSIDIIDNEKTQQALKIRDILFTTLRENNHRIPPQELTDISVQKTIMFSGFIEKVFFTQQHLPSASHIAEEHGYRILLYLSSMDYKFEKLLFPIFNAVFQNDFKQSYDRELLRRGNYYYLLLQGIAQQLHRYKDSRSRLKELFPIFDETASSVSGIQHAKHLVLKGVINQKELEAIMISYICWTFSEWIIAQKNMSRADYLKGDVITFNFLLKVGAIQEKDGISWPNFAKMFFEIEQLATTFATFLEYGTYDEAQAFLDKYLSFEPLMIFESRLRTIRSL